MTRIKIAIIDDEPDSIEVLELLLATNESIHIVGTAQSIKKGIKIIDHYDPDIILLDIEMPGMSGFDLLNHYDDPKFKVIFVTGYDHYAIRAIKYSALDYILKPIDNEELENAINKAILQKEEDKRFEHIKKFSQSDFYDKIILQSNNGFRSLEISDIESIESKPGNYALFYLKNGTKILCSKPLKYYEEILPDHMFYRIHKSHIINLNCVSKFSNSNNIVELKTGKKLEVAHRRKRKFYSFMQQNSAR